MKRLLNRRLESLTDNRQEQRNFLWLGLSMLVKNADMPLFTGTELQTFQVKVGLTNNQIGWLGSFGQLAMATSMFSLMGFADRIRNRIRANVWLTVLMAFYPVALILLSLAPPSILRPGVVFPAMALCEVVEKGVIGLIGMVFAAMYARTISNDIRGRHMSLTGVIGGAAGMLFGLAAGRMLGIWGYPHGFTLAFTMAVCLLMLAAYAMRHIKELPELTAEERTGSVSPFSTVREIVKMVEFRLLMFPNITRGLGDAAGGFAMAMGLKRLGLPVEYAGWTTSLIYAGGLLGTAAMGLTVDRFGPGRVLFGADVLIAAGLVGIVLTGSPLVFLFFFGLLMFGGTVEGTTVPLAHYHIVPSSVLGAFMGTRLILLTLTTAIGAPIAGYLLDRMSPVPIFFGCAVIKLVTGSLYWYAFNKCRR